MNSNIRLNWFFHIRILNFYFRFNRLCSNWANVPKRKSSLINEIKAEMRRRGNEQQMKQTSVRPRIGNNRKRDEKFKLCESSRRRREFSFQTLERRRRSGQRSTVWFQLQTQVQSRREWTCRTEVMISIVREAAERRERVGRFRR